MKTHFGTCCLISRLLWTALSAEKLEWGNTDQLNQILQKHPEGFDLILGADIYILSFLSITYNIVFSILFLLTNRWNYIAISWQLVSFQQNSVPPLFDTVKELLFQHGKKQCRFILAYVSRSKMYVTLSFRLIFFGCFRHPIMEWR